MKGLARGFEGFAQWFREGFRKGYRKGSGNRSRTVAGVTGAVTGRERPMPPAGRGAWLTRASRVAEAPASISAWAQNCAEGPRLTTSPENE